MAVLPGAVEVSVSGAACVCVVFRLCDLGNASESVCGENDDDVQVVFPPKVTLIEAGACCGLSLDFAASLFSKDKVKMIIDKCGMNPRLGCIVRSP